jgi:signal transduction histidine kinase
MRRLSLLIAGVAGLGLLVGVVVLSGLRSSAESAEADRWRDHTQTVLLEAHKLLSALQDAESSQRGLLLTEKPEFLKPFESDRKAMDESLARLAELSTGNDLEQSGVAELNRLAMQKMSEMQRTVASMRSGRRADAIARVESGVGRSLMDQLRDAVLAFDAEQTRMLDSRRAVAAEASWLETLHFYALSALGLLALIGAGAGAMAAARTEARAALEKEAMQRQALTRLAHAQRLEALGQLAGGVAHDFNNVLQVVQSSARLIERAPEDAVKARHLAATMSEAAGRGANITRRLLSFARGAELRSEAVDAGALFAALGEILAHTIGPGVDVRMEVNAPLPRLLADRQQLETVLINLATNARDAMEGQGKLTIFAMRETVEEDDEFFRGWLQAGAYVRISVSDTGRGMNPEVLARACEPFFTTKPEGEGTGLGLAIARGFAAQSGGALKIDTMDGAGATVHLWLPCARNLREGPAPAAGGLAQAAER